MIELLITIAVIAILAGMLLPLLHQVRAKAFEITCFGNLRQIGQAADMYSMDFDNYIVPAVDGVYLPEILSRCTYGVKFVRDPGYRGPFRCPGNTNKYFAGGTGVTKNGSGHYLANHYYHGYKDSSDHKYHFYKKNVEVIPSAIFSMADTGMNSGNNTYYFASRLIKVWFPHGAGESRAANGTGIGSSPNMLPPTPGTTNVLYGDGHVQNRTVGALASVPRNSFYQNNSHKEGVENRVFFVGYNNPDVEPSVE